MLLTIGINADELIVGPQRLIQVVSSGKYATSIKGFQPHRFIILIHRLSALNDQSFSKG